MRHCSFRESRALERKEQAPDLRYNQDPDSSWHDWDGLEQEGSEAPTFGGDENDSGVHRSSRNGLVSSFLNLVTSCQIRKFRKGASARLAAKARRPSRIRLYQVALLYLETYLSQLNLLGRAIGKVDMRLGLPKDNQAVANLPRRLRPFKSEEITHICAQRRSYRSPTALLQNGSGQNVGRRIDDEPIQNTIVCWHFGDSNRPTVSISRS